MAHYVSNCSKNEHGWAHGGEAGDQTGAEYYVRPWYDYGQDQTARHPDGRVRYLIAKLATEAADNDRIGYDQGERTTFWEQLQRAGYDPKAIRTPCEADCSSSTAAIVKAVGHIVGDRLLQGVSAHMWTGIERSELQRAGFEIITGAAVRDPARLVPGDIQFNDAHHTNIYIGTRREGPEPPRTGRRTMDCIISIKGDSTLLWFDGENVNDLTDVPDVAVLDKVAQAATGEKLPRVTLDPEEFARLCQSIKGGFPKHLKKLVDKYPTRSPEE